MTVEAQIRELENKIVAVCMRCPHVKWYTGFFECRTSRRHCHSARVRRWLDEIKKLEGQKMVTAFDTWKCHICGEERPDDKISVLSKPLIINGQVCGEQNIRYCNDRPACIEGANEFSFFEGRE